MDGSVRRRTENLPASHHSPYRGSKMLLHEKQIVYWSLANPEVGETWAESKLTLDDFILGPFDAECLGK
jgi:hypothetical protein